MNCRSRSAKIARRWERAARRLLAGEDLQSIASEITRATVKTARHAGGTRAIADGRNVVSEGRDQGTVVFPHAERKFFLVADSVERARRRHRDLLARGEQITLEEVLRSTPQWEG